MAQTIAQLQAVISADTSKFESGVQSVGEHTSKLGGLFGAATSGIGGMITAGLGIVGIQASIGGAVDAVKGFIDAGRESAQVQAQVNAAIASTHGVAGMTSDAIDQLSTNISNMSGIDDDAVKTGSAMLLTFTNIGQNVFPQATQAIADMATKMNGGAIPSAQQLQQQAILVGKALNDPTKGLTALTRVGVSFTDQQKAQITAMEKAGNTAGAQAIILGELNKEFGGSAEAAGNADGGVAKFQNSLQQMQQAIGGAILPVLGKLLTAITPIVQSFTAALPGAIDTAEKAIQPLLDAIGGVIAQILPQVQSLFKDFTSGASGAKGPLDVLKGAMQQASPIVKTLGDIFTNTLMPAIKDLMPIIKEIVTNDLAVFQAAFKNVGPVLTLVGTILHNVILPVFHTLADVIAQNIMPVMKQVMTTIMSQLMPAFIKLYTAIEPLLELLGNILQPLLRLIGWLFQNIIGPALLLVINLISFLITVIADIIGFITHFGDVMGWLGDKIGGLFGHLGDLKDLIVGGIKLAFQGFQDDINNVTSAVQNIIGWIGNLLGKLGQLKDSALGSLGNLASHLPGFAGGTDDAPGGFAIVGEHGPEPMYVPPHAQIAPHGALVRALQGAGGGTSGGGRGGVTIGALHVHGDDADSTARAVVSELNWQQMLYG